MLTCAPTRSGKGVSSIIPNLLSYSGSVIVIDPKGENAKIAARRRSELGATFVVDPFGKTGLPAARFNPLDMLTPESPSLIEDCLLIAEALVVQEEKGDAQHFSAQATDLIKNLLYYLAVTPGEVRTLGRLRDMLTGSLEDWTDLSIKMGESKHKLVVAAAAQNTSKTDREWLSIVSTAQRNTHLLDSPALRKSLEASDFDFAELKGDRPVSIFLVLPIDRLSTYARWLRMIVSLALATLSRTDTKPKLPVLFQLDEFAALGRMSIIEDAYALFAGMGLLMHAVVQDLAQLQRIYGDGWQTFVANSGVIQVFGTRDLMTANYFSSLAGVTTATVRSSSTNSGTSSSSSAQGASSSTSSGSSLSWAPTQRPLLFPDELMRMDSAAQVLFVENADPIVSDKIVWHSDPDYKTLGQAYVA